MLLLIDKPPGITSFDVIRILQKKFPEKKVGHAGTLDPFASGLLLIAVGDTKQLTELIGLDKTYDAEVIIGIRTDTGDPTGKIMEEKKVGHISEDDLKHVVKRLEGKHILPVPAYSAMKQGGKRLYALAREGKKMIIPMREMEIHRAEFKGSKKEGDHILINVKFEVGSGTYIRSLAEELGKRLGYPASLKNLRRTKIGNYSVEDAEKLENEE